ncbi:hypothetical protein CMI37_37600 [Candidatus Pacearchaeota archaeon]|nr:hypothetical protein [Candidatus Pacearchaeota archaeon]
MCSMSLKIQDLINLLEARSKPVLTGPRFERLWTEVTSHILNLEYGNPVMIAAVEKLKEEGLSIQGAAKALKILKKGF